MKMCKSTLLKIMAGVDREYNGEAKLADGIKVGYLAQEPELNNSLNVYENVMEGMAEAKQLVDDFNAIYNTKRGINILSSLRHR